MKLDGWLVLCSPSCRDHCRHQAQLRIVSQCCQLATLFPPPFGALWQTCWLCAPKMSHEGVRIMLTRSLGAAQLSAPTVQLEELMCYTAIERPEAIESRTSEETLYLTKTSAVTMKCE